MSELSRKMFEAAAARNVHLAIARLPFEFFGTSCGEIKRDRDHITCLRSCLMKPEHLDWIEPIWRVVTEVATFGLPA